MLHNVEEVKALLSSRYDAYELLDILELGPVELVDLLTDYIEDNLKEINFRIA